MLDVLIQSKIQLFTVLQLVPVVEHVQGIPL